MAQVVILLSSQENKGVADKATDLLDSYGISYDLKLAETKNLKAVQNFVESCDASLFICISSKAATLPSMVAAHTNKPVIGVPVSEQLGGLDALLSMSQAPDGTPVATVGLDNGKNAAHLAARILGMAPSELSDVESISSVSETPSLSEAAESSDAYAGFAMFNADAAPRKVKKKREPSGDW